MDQDLIATPIARLACSQCRHEMEVAGRPAFSRVTCPQCGTELTVPVMLGSFLLVERMGSGGMGAVFRAFDTALNRFVAIKVMKAALGEDAKLVAGFIREAQAAAALNHRNIVQIYSCGQESGQPYIVMELVTGGKMSQLFSKEQPMDEVRLLKLAIDVAEGLKAANDVGLVHGDIKPENVLIDHAGTGKIVDFGLAQFVNAQKDRGEIWGTPYYISPERARGNKADHRSDIYSLGATMFHALAGQPPFDGKTAVDVVLERLKHPPPNLHELRPDLQPPTVELIERMMAADPYLRYPNSASLKADMHAALTAAKTAKEKAHHPNRSANRSSRVIGGVAVAVLLAAAFMVFRWYQAEQSRPAPAPAVSTPMPSAPKPEKPAAEEDDIVSFEEIKGPDGKIKLRMKVSFFPPAEEATIAEAAALLAAGDAQGSVRVLAGLEKSIKKGHARAAWLPVLSAMAWWTLGDEAKARTELEHVASRSIQHKEDHPAFMPQVLARYALGSLDEAAVRRYRALWPPWYGDLFQLFDGLRDVQRGELTGGRRKLQSYLERGRTDPTWVYAYRPATAGWLQALQDVEDVRRRATRLLEADKPGPALEVLKAYQFEAPPMLGGLVERELEAAREAGRAQQAAEAEAAARRRRALVQQDLVQVDAALAEVSAMLMRTREFRKASISLSTLPSRMQSDEGRLAAGWVRDVADRLEQLKTQLIQRIDVLPYRREDGSDLGGDVISASTLGVRVSLDGRSLSTRNWEAIPVRSIVKMAEFYAQQTRFSEQERAELLTSLAVFCLVNGAFEPATNYARQAVALRPEAAAEVRRLLAGLYRDA